MQSWERTWTERLTAIPMSAAAISSQARTQAKYERPAPPSSSGYGIAVSPSSPIRVKRARS